MKIRLHKIQDTLTSKYERRIKFPDTAKYESIKIYKLNDSSYKTITLIASSKNSFNQDVLSNIFCKFFTSKTKTKGSALELLAMYEDDILIGGEIYEFKDFKPYVPSEAEYEKKLNNLLFLEQLKDCELDNSLGKEISFSCLIPPHAQ